MYVVVDVGGTNTRIAFFHNLESKKYTHLSVKPTLNNYKKDLNQIEIVINKYTRGKISGIGVGLTGILNSEKTHLLEKSGSLSSWRKRPLKKDLEETFGCPVLLENDATAAALGEAVFGYGKKNDFLFIVWGTGIGGTEVKRIANRILAFSFEPGHQIIKYSNKEKCWCGQIGCIGFQCTGWYLSQNYPDISKISAKTWNEIIERMATMIVNLVVIRPVELVVLNGGVILNQKHLLSDLQKKVDKQLKLIPSPKIKISKLKENAGIYGALVLFQQQDENFKSPL